MAMKNLYRTVFFFLVCFLSANYAHAQNEVEQRVERYLYTNYNTNKAAIRENERLIRILEEKFDTYLIGLNKESQSLVKGQEKEIKQYLQQVEKIKDVKVLKKMMEEFRTKNIANLDRFVNKGLSTPEDAVDCRKIIIMRLVEHELLSQKQQKLLALLKDDYSRQQFIEVVVKNGGVKETEDIKSFTQSVDSEVDEYRL